MEIFVNCNLITGLCQRLDKLRKKALASFIPFEASSNSSISPLWVFRGQELVSRWAQISRWSTGCIPGGNNLRSKETQTLSESTLPGRETTDCGQSLWSGRGIEMSISCYCLAVSTCTSQKGSLLKEKDTEKEFSWRIPIQRINLGNIDQEERKPTLPLSGVKEGYHYKSDSY